jgi:hypothetical protein
MRGEGLSMSLKNLENASLTPEFAPKTGKRFQDFFNARNRFLRKNPPPIGYLRKIFLRKFGRKKMQCAVFKPPFM